MNRLPCFGPLALALFLVAGCSEQDPAKAPADDKTPDSLQGVRDLNGNGTLEPYEDPDLPVEQRVEDLLSRMSLEQKVRMVNGTGWSPEERSRDLDKVPGAAGYTYALEELGIPAIALADGPAGLRISPTRKGDDNTYYATAFPVETLLASSWDTDLLRKVGTAMGNEVKEYGVDILLAPGMNIHRNPLGGRNFEYYSEDPYLSGHMASAMVEGVESAGVGATLKHYVANNQETNRLLLDTIVGERALREIYLRGFEIAVHQADPWAVMSAYNQVNGTFASQSKPLLSTVLRDEWGFGGVVMTDWYAGNDSVAQTQAGNELLMPGTEEAIEQLRKAASNGELSEATLDRNLRYIFNMVFRSPSFAGYDYSDKPDLQAHAKVARDAAAEGAVLLKNEGGVLPLDTSVSHIAAFGTTSYDFIAGGAGSGDVNEAYTVSLVQGLEARGYEIDPELRKTYETYVEEEKAKLPERDSFFELEPPIPEMGVSAEVLNQKASEADIAFITIGRNSGEFQDRELEGDFYLTAAEKELIEQVSEAFHAADKKVVLILNVGNVVETVSWRDRVDAIVLPWQGGQEAGNAVVDVLTGDVNPSGKLPTTFPVRYEDVPSSKSFPGVELPGEPVEFAGGLLTAKPSRVEHREGIYVGYRYYDRFNVEPAYEFGYGLSYTDFEYGKLDLSEDRFSDRMTVRLTVTNSGDLPGKEVVQLYLSAPAGHLHKPVKELKGYAKTRQLAPDESQEITFSLQARDLASFHDSRSAWVAEAGDYMISVGASSRDIRSTGTFKLEQERVVQKALADLSPEREIEEFKPPKNE